MNDSLVADDSVGRFLTLLIAAASSIAVLMAFFLGVFGSLCVAAIMRGQGRSEGRAIITISIAIILLTSCLLFATLGILGIRSSLRRYMEMAVEKKASLAAKK